MRIALRFTIEVDAEDWAYEYGLEPAQVREDVLSWVHETLEGAPVPLKRVTRR